MSDIVLKIDNVYSNLLTSDLRLKKLLSEKLRFRPKNYFHCPAYQKKVWDGWENFFSPVTGKFLTGLLPEVILLLKAGKLNYSVVDNRVYCDWVHNEIKDDFLNQWLPDGHEPFKMHDYQPDLVNKALKAKRCLIQAPTGAGKTFIMISIMKCLPPKTPTLFITKNSSLVEQNYMDMKEWGVPDLGRWYDKFKEPNYIICATNHFKTFESLGPLLPKFKVLIVDEVHDCMSKVPIAAYKKMKSCSVRFGISATAFRWDKKTVDQVHKWNSKGHFGPLLITDTTESGHLTTKELQERKILSKSECRCYVIDNMDLEYEPYQSAVTLGIEQNFGFHKIVSDLAKKCTGRTLVVVDRIEHGEYLKQLIPDSTFINGKKKLKERLPVLDTLKKGEKAIVIVMKQIITAGINVKIHDLINACGGESAHNLIQLLGRGLRLAEDKELVVFHDFIFKINPHLEKHSNWRVEVLKKEGHKVLIKNVASIYEN